MSIAAVHQRVGAVRPGASVVFLLAAALVTYWPSTIALQKFWSQNPFVGGHGPLIALISLGLVLRALPVLNQTPMRSSVWGCVALLVCSIVWVVFWRSAIQELHLLLLPVLLLLAVLAGCGREAAGVVAFPVGYLYFAEPPWHVLTQPLQALTLKAVSGIGPLVGLPVRIDNALAYLPQGVTFEVTPLCSGLNFLVIGLAVAALIGELQRVSLARRALLLASVALLTIASNWVRVLSIMYAGYSSGMRHVLATREHVLFGWILFALVMLGFAWVVRRESAEAPPARTTQPAQSRLLPGSCAALGAMITVPVLAWAVDAGLAGEHRPLSVRLPSETSPWQGPFAPADILWKPEFVGPHSEWHVAYRDDTGATVELVAIGYSSQTQGRKLMSESNSLLGRALTATAGASPVHERPPHVEQLATDAQGHRFVIWSVYEIGGRQFVSPVASQLWYGVSALRGPTHSVLLAYRAACEPSCDAARARLLSFVHSVASDIAITRAEAAYPARADRPA